MVDQDHLIRLLNHEGAQSGTAIGQVLGVSMVSVQKRIQHLVDNGLPIAAVSGKGYSLPSGVRLLDKQEIVTFINDAAWLESIEVLQTTESTNTHLLNGAMSIGSVKVCLAERQTVGRGRRGNDWQSAPYRNIMLSMSWGFSNWPETIAGLGLAAALVVAEHLNSEYQLDVKIKWPNDLLIDQNKLGGILIDVAGESSGACNVVIGLGLNVHQPDWSQQDSAYRWQDLHSLGVVPNRNELVARILEAWQTMLQAFDANSFGPLAKRWNVLSSYAEQSISVDLGEHKIVGEMLGVDEAGELLVQSGDGEVHRISDSNVSVRLI